MISTRRSNSSSSSSQSPRSPLASQPFLSVTVTDPVKLGNGVQAYISYRVITKATMVDRANAFKQQYDLVEATKLKEINVDKLMLIRSVTAAEAQIEYKELRAESEEAAQRYEHIVKLMTEEIVRFQEQKTADIGLAFHEFAEGQERLAKDMADAWRSRLPMLEACSPCS